MKILFPFVGDSVGGSHISTLELYLSLVESGVSAVIVLHKDNGPLSRYLHSKEIPFSILESPRLAGEEPRKLSILIGMLTNFFHFGNFIKKNKIDIVHGNDLRINLSWSLPAKFFSKGFIWHQRTLLSNSKFWLLISYLCDYFVAISDIVMESSPKNISNIKKNIVYNPFNVSPLVNKKSARTYLVERYNIPHDCFLLGCVGRVVNYKNLDFVIKNISNIRQDLNIYLIIVGTGLDDYTSELKAYSYNIGVDRRVIFTGFLSNPDKIIASLDLLVAPSLVDAFGRSIVEAMLQKTPVLAAKSGGHVGIINEGVNGMFYDPTIKNNFIDKISIIMNSKNMQNISDNAYSFAKKNFSSKQHLNNILNIYSYVFKN